MVDGREKMADQTFARNELLTQIEKLILLFRMQKEEMGYRLAFKVMDALQMWIKEQTELADSLLPVLQQLYEAQKNRDTILLADLYETQLLPFFYELQKQQIALAGEQNKENYYEKNKKFLQKNMPAFYQDILRLEQKVPQWLEQYQVEYTACGDWTLAVSQNGKRFYLHSNINPKKEAFLLANTWCKEGKLCYLIYGAGLLYHAAALAQQDAYITVHVYESNPAILLRLCQVIDLAQQCVHGNLEIHYDEGLQQLSTELQKQEAASEFVVHIPSMRCMADSPIKERLEEYVLQYYSVQAQQNHLYGNFKENQKQKDQPVDVLEAIWSQKTVYIIAAGPSLDKNMQLLREVDKDAIILATGTVFRKLLQANISPDYVIVTDANARVYAQIAGYETEQIPMLYLSTAYAGFAKNYQASKYVILQEGFYPAEQYAKQNGYRLYQTGGSVSTVALDMSLRLHCKRIVLVGLDLAYTDGYAHAMGTSRRTIPKDEMLETVEDITGGQVVTVKPLRMFQHWIEDRIKQETETEIIDATEGGAKIKGTKIQKLKDVIQQQREA